VFLSLADIESTMKNEFGNPLGLVILGGVAGFTWPEIWVNDADYEEASKIVKEKGSVVSRPPQQSDATWRCPKCGEIIEEPMNACWKCETERPSETGL
jgi:hypothetical protein